MTSLITCRQVVCDIGNNVEIGDTCH